VIYHRERLKSLLSNSCEKVQAVLVWLYIRYHLYFDWMRITVRSNLTNI